MTPLPGTVLRTRRLVLLVEEVDAREIRLAFLDEDGMPLDCPSVWIPLRDWEKLPDS